VSDPYDDGEGHGGSPHEAFDPDQLIGPDDVLLGVAPLRFTGSPDATGFQPGVDRMKTAPEFLADAKAADDRTREAHPALMQDITGYNEGTLFKVRDALLSCSPGLDEDAVTNQINAMQAQGILFREQVASEEELDDYHTYNVVDAAGSIVRRIVVAPDLHMSDRYHTFDDLYDHRRKLTAVLATIGSINGDSWRSKLHHPDDGPMFDGSFIVGIELPGGPISYHYPLDSWDEFAAVPELEHAPKWDGAGPAETLTRLTEFTGHLMQAIDDGHVVQQVARAAADEVVEHAVDHPPRPCTHDACRAKAATEEAQRNAAMVRERTGE
jgi:hypothetical protein